MKLSGKMDRPNHKTTFPTLFPRALFFLYFFFIVPMGSFGDDFGNPIYERFNPVAGQFAPGTYLTVVVNFVTGEVVLLPTEGPNRPPVFNKNGSPYRGNYVPGNGGHQLIRDVLMIPDRSDPHNPLISRPLPIDKRLFNNGNFGGGGIIIKEDGSFEPVYKSGINPGGQLGRGTEIPERLKSTFIELIEEETGLPSSKSRCATHRRSTGGPIRKTGLPSLSSCGIGRGCWMDRYAKWDRNTGGAPTQVVSMAAHFTIGLLNEATQGMVEAPKDEQGRFIPGAHPFRNGTDTGIMNFLFGDATYLRDVPGYWIYQATGYNIRDKWFYEWMP